MKSVKCCESIQLFYHYKFHVYCVLEVIFPDTVISRYAQTRKTTKRTESKQVLKTPYITQAYILAVGYVRSTQQNQLKLISV